MERTKVETPLNLREVEIPKEFNNPYNNYLWFCVIDGKKARSETDKESEVIEWCFDHIEAHDIPEIRAIGYARFESEPVMKEWIDKATPYYLEYAKTNNRYKKWKKGTAWKKELDDLRLR